MRRKLLFALLLASLVACDDGSTKSYWDDGTLKSVLRYENGKLNGECLWYYANGKPMMQACYKANAKDGRFMRWHENGNLMEDCYYKDNELDSVYRSYSLKGILASEEHYSNGKLDGEFKKWYDNGQVFQDGQYADDMMDGSWLIFYSDGVLAAQAQFDKGSGTQTCYEQSGYKCMVTNYKDNLKHGREYHYNPDGTLTHVLIYEYGEVVGEERNNFSF